MSDRDKLDDGYDEVAELRAVNADLRGQLDEQRHITGDIERKLAGSWQRMRRLEEAALNLLGYVERNECHHEETHRGGAIWTICDGCDMKWADDRGGFVPYEEPAEIAALRDVLFPAEALK